MNQRKLFSSAGLLVIAAIFLAGTVLIEQINGRLRLDLTADGLYSLSDGSRNIVGEVEMPLEAYLYFSDGLSKDLPMLRNYAKRVEELLEEYEYASNGKLAFKMIDPEPFSEEEDQAVEYGLQGVPLTVGGDNLYFGLVVVGEQGQEVIPFLQPDQEAFLEYEISQAIYRANKPQKTVVGMISVLDVAGGYDVRVRQRQPEWMFYSHIQELFDAREIDSNVRLIDSDVDVLMVVHPKLLPQHTLYAIDQFVLAGGKALVFVDPNAESDLSEFGLNPMDGERFSDLEQLFSSWGVNYDKDQVVTDAKFALVVNMGENRRPEPHPAVLSLSNEGLNREVISTSQLEMINLSTVGVLASADSATTRFTPLLQTSEIAMTFGRERFKQLPEPRELFNEFEPTGERYTIAAQIQGSVQTAFPDGPPVDDEEAQAETDAAEPEVDAETAPEEKVELPAHLAQSTGDINVVVVADTDILADRLWVQVGEFFGRRIAEPWANNGNFVTNVLDNLGGSADLITVRSRGQFSRPFELVDDLERQAEERFRTQEQELTLRLEETEAKLLALSNPDNMNEGVLELNAEQEAEIVQFEQEKLRIRKKLREVQHNLNKDIESLGTQLKVANVVAVPAILTLLVLLAALLRRRRVS